MKIKVFAGQDELDRYAAGLLLHIVSQQERPVLGLATGSTPIGIYQAMVQAASQSGLSFRHATTYNLDEYVGLAPDHEQSYRYYMEKHLFRHLDIPASQTHIPDGRAVDLQAECRRYDAMLAAQPLDVQLLGIGHNGHIGFNEPAEELRSGTHVVQLKEETRAANARFFNHQDEVPDRALTMGVGSILKAKQIILVARGADKAQIVKQALQGPITTRVPASLLQTHAHVTVLLDRDAGREWMEDGTKVEMAHS
ncbi:glucosamine-6-phosphate deaminase [Paenibacillus sp. SYP-B4298]|uniref:glucosamine-6-phosphate deaminase n=1 Tax=Paenibacillus sp. SYP-B4298 TaxID=2996034 RepID=UPI0022DE0E78|nr:glucosamine-6-phosphate deaminase [Paenibacillus sp. SYP-B4298]